MLIKQVVPLLCSTLLISSNIQAADLINAQTTSLQSGQRPSLQELRNGATINPVTPTVGAKSVNIQAGNMLPAPNTMMPNVSVSQLTSVMMALGKAGQRTPAPESIKTQNMSVQSSKGISGPWAQYIANRVIPPLAAPTPPQGQINLNPFNKPIFEPKSPNNLVEAQRVWNKEFGIPSKADIAKANEMGLMVGERFSDRWKSLATVGQSNQNNRIPSLDELRNGATINAAPAKTKHGVDLSFLEKGSYLEKAAKYAEFPANMFVVNAHGVMKFDIPVYDANGYPTSEKTHGPTMVKGNADSSTLISPREVYEKMLANGYKDGQCVILLACNLGDQGIGAHQAFAQQLAELIRKNSIDKSAKVYGATKPIWLNQEGNYFISGSDFYGNPNMPGQFVAY